MGASKELVEKLRMYSQDLVAYKLGCEFADAVNEAATAIEKLEADIEVVRKEKETAVSHLKKYARRCRICKHFNKKSSDIGKRCKTCKNFDNSFFFDNWEYDDGLIE